MFQEPRQYPLVPSQIRDYLRNINGVIIPQSIKGDIVETLSDIQVVIVGDSVIPHYSDVESVWVDAVYDSWYQIGKVDDTEKITKLAVERIQNISWWSIK